MILCSAVLASSPPLQTWHVPPPTGLVFPRNRTPLALCRRGSTPSFSQRALGCKRAPRVHFHTSKKANSNSPALNCQFTASKTGVDQGRTKGALRRPFAPTLTLVNLMHGTHCILPPRCRWTSVDHERMGEPSCCPQLLPVPTAWLLEMRSCALIPSIETTVATGLRSLTTCNACATHSQPALV